MVGVDFPIKVPYLVKAFSVSELRYPLRSNINLRKRRRKKQQQSQKLFFAFLWHPIINMFLAQQYLFLYSRFGACLLGSLSFTRSGAPRNS